ncbi:MAG TPA: prephenate dehydratase [Thermoanaerobaculia bacterium]|nr:prephenate dehydratase [Thermoanaerobaculia bacterium]
MPAIIAFQGERGAFSEAACRELLGPDVELLPCHTFDDVFGAVKSGAAAGAVIPIENSLAGSVLRNYELLGPAGLEIVGEVLLRIRLSVLAAPGVKLESVRRMLSHPVALAQCQRFLAARPDIEAVATHDTAGSVRMVLEHGRRDEAAIAGASSAEVYGATVLAENIEDHAENYTRFLLLTRAGERDAIPVKDSEGPRKTTILFRTPNKPGALFRALAAFALRDINLTKLESRPIEGRPWEYAFYADIGGDPADGNVANALNHLREMCESVVILGSYAAGRLS